MNNLIQNYTFILDEFKKLATEENFYFKPINSKLSDLELITLNITTEYCGIDSEYQLFRNLKGSRLGTLIERSVYNKRKRKLFPYIDELRKKLVQKLNGVQDYFVVDSMPLEVCKNAREARSKICKEEEYAFPNHGFCAAQNSRYYGYKLHAVCSIDGVLDIPLILRVIYLPRYRSTFLNL